MPKRAYAVSFAALACGALVACGTSDMVAPHEARSALRAASQQGPNEIHPGPRGAPAIIQTSGGMKGCERRDAQYGTTTIGPSGGRIGCWAAPLDHSARSTEPKNRRNCRLLSPKVGRRRSSSSRMACSSRSQRVSFSTLATALTFPTFVYINEIGITSAPIIATYSTWWHTIAAPIDHFSGYAVAF